ncbi:hypothetical protein EGW08_018563 [Elysia chlorotica]|uniref:Tetraspanin n=1 Tax=Elysia chlorotica TaxID=188477 RepID=A0A433SWX0_ELYCH|nr:hypothetical protein EGW08_018563 [Elysia chlorotica]
MLLLVVSLGLVLAAVTAEYFLSYFTISKVKALPSFSTYANYLTPVDEREFEIVFSGFPQRIGVMLFVSQTMYLLAHIFYVTYGIHKMQFTLPVGALSTGSVTFAEITIINVLFSPKLIADETRVNNLKKKLHSYQVRSNKTFDISYDYMSVFMRCCGITDEYDFFQTSNLGYQKLKKDGTTAYHKVQVAPTCCRRDVFAKGVESVDMCAKHIRDNYIQGCFSLLVKNVVKGCRYYTIVIWIHLLDLIFHSSLYRKKVKILSQVLDYKSEKQDVLMEYYLKEKLIKELRDMENVSTRPVKKKLPRFRESLDDSAGGSVATN